MRVTEHFDSDEFDQHSGYGLDSAPYPSDWIETKLRPLCDVLEAIRAELGAPIRVVSGFRSVEYNRAMYAADGQSPTDSQHSKGTAADIQAAGVKAAELHATIFRLYQAGTIRIGGLGKYNSFVHVDIRPQSPAGHLAQWDKSTTRADDSTTGAASSGEEEGDAEEQDEASIWIAPIALLAAVLLFVFWRYT